MSSLFGFTVLFGLLILLMRGKVVHGAGGLDEECEGTTCTDANHVCDTNMFPNKCRIKIGATCTSNAAKCVDGATCDDANTHNCVCVSARSPATASNTCSALVPLNGDCSGQKTCSTGLVCDGVCKIKSGESCASHTDKCVDGATCDGSHNCVCGTGRTPATAEGRCSVAVGGDCGSERACGTDLVCENDLCKIKSGASCASHTDKCVDGATCDGSHICVCGTDTTPATTEGKCPVAVGGDCSAGRVCGTDLICENDLCKIKSGASCASHTDKCVDGATCDVSHNCVCGTDRTPATAEGKCPVAVGGNCSAGRACGTDLVCENDICKIKHGASCASHTDKCVEGATCDGSHNCVCGTDRTATTEGQCPVAVGGNCGAGKTCGTDLLCENNVCKIKNGATCTGNTDKCVDGATCDGSSHNCVCGAGRTPATAEGRCPQVKSQSGSANLLTSILLTYVFLITSSVMSSCFF